MILDFFKICITGVILFLNNLWLAVFLTIAYFSAALWAYQHSKILKSLNVKLRNETDIHFKLTRDILKGIKWICISNSGIFHYKRYAENLEYVKRQTINRDEKAWKLSYVSTIMGYGWNIIFLGYSIWQLGLNKLILTKFMLFLSYSRIYTSGIANLFERYSGLQPIRVSVERVFQLVDKYENQEKEERKTVFPEKLEEIEFVDLTFCYGENTIIANLSKKVENKIVLITGKNGQGKSTLLNLMAGMLIPVKGDIFYNGISVCDIAVESMYCSLSYAFQDEMVFDMSIKDNILCFAGYETVTEESLLEVCKDVGILEDILSLEKQFDTQINEIRDFSFGQKKKILLARACLRPSQILLLDEPLEGLDKQSQELFIELLLRLANKKYIFISTHNPARFKCEKDIISL